MKAPPSTPSVTISFAGAKSSHCEDQEALCIESRLKKKTHTLAIILLERF